MSELQVQAKALGDPTRHEIFRHISEAPKPADVAELTELLGCHHNAVRQHLAKLVDAGLVAESTAPPAGPGRPRLCYTVAPTAESRWGVEGPYQRLALLLTEIIKTGETPVQVGRRVGSEALTDDAVGGDPLAGLVDSMARQGFDPTVQRRGELVDIVLGACPFQASALADPDTVCSLHLGLAIGAADALGGIEIDELVPVDPRRGSCRLAVRATTRHVRSQEPQRQASI